MTLRQDPTPADAGSDERPPPRIAGWIWLVYGGLYAASIPWYLPATDHPAIWLGLPYWVVLSLAATGAVAGFTTLVVSRCWPDVAPPTETSSPSQE